MIRQRCGCIKAVILLMPILIAAAGCSVPEHGGGLLQTSPAVTGTPAPETATLPAMATLMTVPATPSITTAAPPAATITAAPVPASTTLPDAAINARIVDARNKLSNMIDTNVADTVIIQTDRMHGCEVKKSRELAYLIDLTTGESTFVKGDYWHIDADLFTDRMRKDREYIIIHTHPKVWETCAGSGIISLNTFSLGDLAAAANMTRRGYHIKELIAIADRDYRIWPGQKDGWKSGDEILLAIMKIEAGSGQGYLQYDPVQDSIVYDLDSRMPFLAKELGYHYTINNNVIS
jgi:hypothetical protein